MPMPRAFRPITVAAAALGLLAACGDHLEDDIRQRFAERHDRALCFRLEAPYPAVIAAGPAQRETLLWLSALERAGLLSRRELPADGDPAAAGPRLEFSLTDAGRAQIRPAQGFCYGRAEIVEVIDYTRPSEINGAATVQAEARLRRRIDADWARDPALAALIATGDDTVRMLLINKAKGGWSPAY